MPATATKAANPDHAADFEKWTGHYVAVRDKIAEIKERHEKELEEPLKTQKDLTAKLEGILDATNAQSIKTSKGTVYRTVRYSASLQDPQAFMDYVIANNKFELLDRKANATACRDFVEETGGLPPGVNINSISNIGVRRK